MEYERVRSVNVKSALFTGDMGHEPYCGLGQGSGKMCEVWRKETMGMCGGIETTRKVEKRRISPQKTFHSHTSSKAMRRVQ